MGPYFATGGFNPVSLVADPSVVRAWDGGSGNFKMGANYAPTIYPHMEVRQRFQATLIKLDRVCSWNNVKLYLRHNNQIVIPLFLSLIMKTIIVKIDFV